MQPRAPVQPQTCLATLRFLSSSPLTNAGFCSGQKGPEPFRCLLPSSTTWFPSQLPIPFPLVLTCTLWGECVCARARAHACWGAVRGEFSEVSFSPLIVCAPGSRSTKYTVYIPRIELRLPWQQVPLPAKPFHRPLCVVLGGLDFWGAREEVFFRQEVTV